MLFAFFWNLDWFSDFIILQRDVSIRGLTVLESISPASLLDAHLPRRLSSCLFEPDYALGMLRRLEQQ